MPIRGNKNLDVNLERKTVQELQLIKFHFRLKLDLPLDINANCALLVNFEKFG